MLRLGRRGYHLVEEPHKALLIGAVEGHGGLYMWD